MKLVALMPVRNEAWCLGLSARVALRWCDVLILGMHACTDESWDIVNQLAHEHGDRVIPFPLLGETWAEMEHREMLLNVARGAGATHIAIVDADELLTGNLIPIRGRCNFVDVREWVLDTPPGHILHLPGYNLRNGIHQYHANGLWGNRWFDVAFADDPALHWSGDRFHHRAPMGKDLKPYRPIQQGHGGVMHLWGSSERRLRAKHAMYSVTELLRWPHKTADSIRKEYSQWRSQADAHACHRRPEPEWNYHRTPAEWWDSYADLMQYLDVDSDPWQEAEVRRLVAEHGREKFAGLDLFGVA